MGPKDSLTASNQSIYPRRIITIYTVSTNEAGLGEAVKLATQVETVEATQKAIYRGPPSQTMAIGLQQYEKEIEALSQQIRTLTTEIKNLKNSPEDYTSSTRCIVVMLSKRSRTVLGVWSLWIFPASMSFETIELLGSK